MKKPNSEWLTFMTPEEQKKFKTAYLEQGNTEEDFEHFLLQKLNSFNSFVSAAFVWSFTEQGESYWRNIART